MLRFFYTSIAATIAIGLVLLAAWPIVLKPRLNAYVVQRIHSLGKEAGILIRADDISLVSTRQIEIRLAKIEDLKGEWALQLPKAEIQLSPVRILFGKQPLRSIVLSDPQLWLFAMPSGEQHATSIAVPKGLNSVVINDGTLRLELPAQKTAFAAHRISLEARRLKDAFTFAVRIPLLALQSETFSFDEGTFDLDGQLKGTAFAIDALTLDTPLGQVSADGSLDTKDGVRGQGHFAIKELELDDINIDFAEGRFKVDDTELALSELAADFGNARVRGGLTLDLSSGRTSVSADAAGLSLYHMLLDLGIKPCFVDMNIDAHLQAQGQLWPHFVLNGEVRGQATALIVADRSAHKATQDDIILRADGPIHVNSAISVDAKAFRFHRAQISDATTSGSADCTLFFKKDKGLFIRALSDDFDFTSIADTIANQQYRGRGALETTIQGAYDAIRVDASARVSDFVYEGVPFGNLNGRLSYAHDLFRISDVQGAAPGLHYFGDLSFLFQNDIVMDLKLRHLEGALPDLASRITEGFDHKLWDFIAQNAEGLLVLDLELQGPLTKGEGTRLFGSAHLHASDGLRVGDVSVRDLRGEIILKAHEGVPHLGGMITLEDVETPLLDLRDQKLTFQSDDRGQLQIAGSLLSGLLTLDASVDPRADYRYHADLSWPYTSINRYLKDAMLPGQAVLEFAGAATIDGSASLPFLLQGHIDNGFLNTPFLSEAIRPVSARFEMDRHELRLLKAEGVSSRGHLSAKGTAALLDPGMATVALDLDVQDFYIQYPKWLNGVLNGTLSYHQNTAERWLNGDLRLRDGYISGKLSKDSFLKLASRAPSSFRPVHLDVKLGLDEAIKVDSDIVSGFLEGQLRLIGSHLSPGLQGTLELKMGKALFQNQHYQLRKARIDFDDSYHIVPRLDVLAQTEVDSYQVHVQLQGTPERPLLRLSSEPALPESQLLVLMSLGHVMADLKNPGTSLQLAGLEALSLYSGFGQNVTNFLNQQTNARYFAIDELGLSALTSKTDGETLPALRIAMKVGSGLRLRLQSAIAENEKGKQKQRIELEQTLGQHTKWRLAWDSEGQSTFGDAGLDVWYRWEME